MGGSNGRREHDAKEDNTTRELTLVYKVPQNQNSWPAYIHDMHTYTSMIPSMMAHGGTTASHEPMLYRHRGRVLLVERHVEPKIASIEVLLLLLLHPAPTNRRARPRRQRRHPQARGDKPAPARAIDEAPAEALDRVRRP